MHRFTHFVQWCVIGLLMAVIGVGLAILIGEQHEATAARQEQAQQIAALQDAVGQANDKLAAKGEQPVPVPTVTTNPNTGATTVVPGPPGAIGATGATGAPGRNATDAQVSAAVVLYCSTHAECRGADGAPGVPGPAGAEGLAGATGSAGADGAPGAAGADGKNATDTQVAAAVAAYCDAHDQCRGPAGKDGTNGKDGADGVDGATGPKGDTGAAGPAGPTCPDGYAPTSLYVQTRTDPMLPTTQHWEQSTLCLPAAG
ncbi:hypothetical protein ACFT5B_07015 [Luteimicrobium sp. NPDC057192]|uniref:hypothetical protein n=1 Tax=Luteimicrobium sp. NPDC057192 TaxID=3346042 RepID=UPI0036290FF5